MKIKAGEAKIICQNKHNIHNYFAWPSVARLQDGRLAMVASGFRLEHVCPFGKGVICYSDDEGQTWTPPAVIIDTPMDDRDCGICTFGETGVIVTSYNNPIEFYKEHARTHDVTWEHSVSVTGANFDYKMAYLDRVTGIGAEEKYGCAVCVISNDCGKTFGDPIQMHIATPHGPCALPDGNMLFVGCTGHGGLTAKDRTQCWLLRPDGSTEPLSVIENNFDNLSLDEPHAIVLENGKIIVHMRVEHRTDDHNFGDKFTIYQCESYDGGKTFTTPHQLLSDKGGAPATLYMRSDGILVSTYGVREMPYGVKAMFSKDMGETWDIDHVIYENKVISDIGYPSSVELNDGRMLSVYYARPEKGAPCVIMQTIWEIEDKD